MKDNFLFKSFTDYALVKEIPALNSILNNHNFFDVLSKQSINDNDVALKPEILFITSYPPRECGIATYSIDLINAIKEKYKPFFTITICAMEQKGLTHKYSHEVSYILHAQEKEEYLKTAKRINNNKNIKAVFVEHEFGLFGGNYGEFLLELLASINKPVITTFHTVLPNPDVHLKCVVQSIIELSSNIIVMTNNAAVILRNDYNAAVDKLEVIPHGTHLISPFNSGNLNEINTYKERPILATFGLLSANKSIETALDALPAIIEKFPSLLYLILGKTHPSVLNDEGEKYRNFLQEKVTTLGLENNVLFINRYLSLPELLTYLQRTDIYLFTSKDPHQTVSGTFAYAMGCGCPVISTPIPHTKELLDGAGIIFDFQNANQLAEAAINLLSNPKLILQMKLNALHKISPTAWQNAAIKHMLILQKNMNAEDISLKFKIPQISLAHIKRLTTDIGMIQFSAIAVPDIKSGFTLDDNARALVAMCLHYELTKNEDDKAYIYTYFNFIKNCQQPEGNFLNYLDSNQNFTQQNNETNLADSNGRAIWALGYLISKNHILPKGLISAAAEIIEQALSHINSLHATRAMAFTIKGLSYSNKHIKLSSTTALIKTLANRLVQMYRHETDNEWNWFESYLTYGNSILPEALLCAYLETGDEVYKDIALASFNFLLSIIFYDDKIQVVSNRGWHLKGVRANKFGEQPIDVAYTIMALELFYETFKKEEYLTKMETAFNWFLGENHLHQIIYNPVTGGCYDGLEENHINLNQGAESTVSYLISRLIVEKYLIVHEQLQKNVAIENID